MKISTATSLSGILAVTALLGCNLLKKKDDGNEPKVTTETRSAGGSSGATTESTSKPGAGCKLEDVEADFTLKKGCSVTVEDIVHVRKNATLRIEPGVKLMFKTAAMLVVEEGKLVAKGTQKEPITMTSANATQAAGDWAGVHFKEHAGAGSELDFVSMEFTGNDRDYAEGAVTLHDQRSPGRVSITNSTFSNGALKAVANKSPKGAFAKFTGNKMKGHKKGSLDGSPEVLASVGTGNTFGDPLYTRGDVVESLTWPAFDAPVVVDAPVHVRGEKAAAILTLAPKTTLRFAEGALLAVGQGNGGGLVAREATMTSVNASPHAGDWGGVHLHERAANVTIEGSTIEYAGQEVDYAKGAITFHLATKGTRGIKISGNTFRHNKHGAFGAPEHDCGPFVGAAEKNRSEGDPLCAKE